MINDDVSLDQNFELLSKNTLHMLVSLPLVPQPPAIQKISIPVIEQFANTFSISWIWLFG